MKANELSVKDVMVGDWVDVRNSAAPNTPHLERITPSHFLRDEHWYGVELVPEILEKNGFEKGYSTILTADGYKKLPQYKYKNVTQAQNVCRNLIIISYSDLNGGVYDIQCGIGSHIYNLKYVHQLQHALRLCKSDKTIEL